MLYLGKSITLGTVHVEVINIKLVSLYLCHIHHLIKNYNFKIYLFKYPYVNTLRLNLTLIAISKHPGSQIREFHINSCQASSNENDDQTTANGNDTASLKSSSPYVADNVSRRSSARVADTASRRSVVSVNSEVDPAAPSPRTRSRVAHWIDNLGI